MVNLPFTIAFYCEDKNLMEQNTENVQKTYDTIADEYVLRIYAELDHKPLDRQLLDRFAQEVRDKGLVRDVGCGPGHVTSYLQKQGVLIQGIDLSSRMIELARQLNPTINFQQGNMATLDVQDGSWAGIVAFYSIIHFPRPQVVSVLREFYRALQPDGLLLLAFHRGQQVNHLEEWWGRPVSIDGFFFERDEMEGYLRDAGFTIEETIERSPYAEVEVQTQRIYIFARHSKHTL
jgi:SAM-dependent methyltransferase